MSDLKQKYRNLKTQYLALQANFNSLLEAYQHILASNKKHLSTINQLTVEKEILISKLNETRPSGKAQPASSSVAETPLLVEAFKIPDQSGLLEAYVMLGIRPESLESSSASPEILWEFSHSPSVLSPSVRAVLPDFCFPKGFSKRQLKLTGSASDLNALLYGQVPTRRDNNCFVFTMRTESKTEASTETADLPNAGRDVIYGFCVLSEELKTSETADWVVPKCHCILTYVPIFELHYELISSILLLKRLDHMELLSEESKHPKRTLSQISELETDSQELLNKYSDIDTIQPGDKIKIKMQKLGPIVYKCPEDLGMIDVTWNCCPLLASLTFDELFWIVCAVLHEKSILFVSYNIGLVSSCVLGIDALIRPFKWPNIFIPILPHKLIDLVDSPVPILAGICGEFDRSSSAVVVRLDDHEKRVEKGDNEIEEPLVKDLRNALKNQHAVFEDVNECFSFTPERKRAALKFARILQDFLIRIAAAMPPPGTRHPHRALARDIGMPEDKKFFKNLCKTQLFYFNK